ncbi:Pr6Pr family membrane protein [Nocardioides sp. NPDC047086]|uniref:Pr6Pr family membrane protein n=1 Tax=Nocardioides sp. NPDC047086 TaxID=3154810 RepID=UPI003410134B
MTKTWSILRLAMAALILAAILTEFRNAMRTVPAEGSSTATVLVNFFSYFTIESNLFALAALVAGAGWALTRKGPEPVWIAVLLAAATTFMTITGLVYNLLLRGIALATTPWANEVLHLIGPIFLIVDLFFAPPRRLPWRTVAVVISWPILWVVYTLLRGEHAVSPLTGEGWWYPYPFLNPHVQDGFLVVAFYVAGIAAAFTLVAWGVVSVGRRRDIAPVEPSTTEVAP